MKTYPWKIGINDGPKILTTSIAAGRMLFVCNNGPGTAQLTFKNGWTHNLVANDSIVIGRSVNRVTVDTNSQDASGYFEVL